MSNDYFTDNLGLTDFTRARVAPINGLSAQIQTAFDLLPATATFSKALVPTVLSGGTANALTVANETPIASYAMGQRVSFKATTTNTGSATVNVDGLGVKTIKRADGSNLSAGDITSGRIVDLIYDGTDFVVQGTITTINQAGVDVVIAAATDAALAAETAQTAAEDAQAAAEAAIAPYSAADVLAKLVMVDGSSSGLDADLVRGTTPSATGLSLLGTASATAARTTLSLNNVDNTSDLGKPVSTATQSALDLKAPKANPVFTGVVMLPGTPTADLHAATKHYVDQSVENLTNLQAKAAVTCIASSNLDLTGEETIDGVTTSASRVLVNGQTTASQNGLYVSGSGAWARATDADSWTELENAAVVVTGGDTYAGSRWQAVIAEGGTLGSTAVSFVQIAAPASYTASGGITKDGTEFILSDMPDGTLKGNSSGSSGAPDDLTGTEVTALLDTFGVAKGLVPAVTADGTQYLGDGGWDSSLTPASLAASGNVTGANLSGTNTGDQTITLTGDVTGTGTGSFAATIANGAVTLAKMANVATARFIGRTSSGTGSPEALTTAQAKTLLDLTGTNSGDQTTITGNAGTATALQTARNFSITGGATASAVSFDGSAAVALNVTDLDMSKASAGTLPVARGGTGVTGSTGAGNVVLSASPLFSGTANFASAAFSGTAGVAAGSATAPTFRFSGDTNTGLYQSAADTFDITTGGAQRLSVSTTAITATIPFAAATGSAGAPAYSFTGDPNTGFYSRGADAVGFSVGGALAATIDATGIDVVGLLRGDSLRIDANPASSSATTTHKLAVSLNGTTYYMLLSDS